MFSQPRPQLVAAMLQSSLDSIIAIDQDGMTLEFNPAAERTFGWQRAEVLGREMAEVLIPAAHRDRHRAGLTRAKMAGDSAVLDRRLEMTALRSDGTEFPVELTITRVAGDGPPVFTGYLRDITDRRRAERRRTVELTVARVLSQAATVEDGLRGVLHAISKTLSWDVGAVWLMDESGDRLRCTDFLSSRPGEVRTFEADSRRRSFSPGVGLPGRVWVSGQPAWISDVTTDSNFPRAAVAAAIGVHSAFAFPILIQCRVAGVVEFFSHRIEQPDPDLLTTMETIGGYVGQFLQRKRVEASLRDADRRKDEFLAMLAHELRNPLAPIVNALAILQRAGPDPQVVTHGRNVIERQVALLVRLVDDLLDVSRLTLKKVALERSRVSLGNVIERGIETIAPLAGMSDLKIVVNMPASPVWIHADAIRMVQVVSNLVSNAIKFTPAGGRIEVSGEQVGGEAVITVRDDGLGIPRDMLERIFDLFAQVGDARQQGRKGLGIGLTVVKTLVELHGGRVSARSGGAQRGSEFTVTLPIASDDAATETGASSGLQTPHRPSRRVVVVDDSRDAADTLALLLRLMGHEVRAAYDGPGAIEAIREFRPDTALVDLGLPGMTGHELAREVRRLPTGAEIVLIALTGWGQEEDRRRSAEAGFDRHLVKPADPQALDAILMNVTPGSGKGGRA